MASHPKSKFNSNLKVVLLGSSIKLDTIESFKLNLFMYPSEKLMHLSSRQLLAFLEVVRLRSISKAAECIPMSQSGMSMLIKELEDQIGARLFDRNPRSISLTDSGRELLPVAQRIVQELRDLSSAIQGTEAVKRSRLKVAATPMVSMSLLPEIVREFSKSNAQVDITIADVDVHAVRQRVLDGDADIGLGFFVKPAVGLLRQPLCRFRLMCISPAASNRSTRPSSRPWSSLRDLPLIGLPADNPIQSLVEAHLAQNGWTCEQRQVVNFISTVIAMVRAGLGHAIIPSFAIEECKRHGLQISMLTAPVVNLDLYLVTRRGTQPKSTSLEFTARLKATAAELAAPAPKTHTTRT
jgi:DNA-binding transcriptional LysR family regulator